GTAAVSNQANANTIPTDKQFFIWGDDNGLLSNIVATGNSSYPYRFTRVWKTQNTGSFAQNSTVYYPVSTFGNAQASTIALLYGTSAASLSNGTATAIAQSGTTTINGVNYYVFTVPSGQISNIQFFSFTGTITGPGGVLGANLWYRADQGITLNGSNVSGITNYGLTGEYNVTQSIAALQPPYNSSSSLINFNPTIGFSNHYLTDTGTTDLGSLSNSCFVAVKHNAPGAGSGVGVGENYFSTYDPVSPLYGIEFRLSDETTRGYELGKTDLWKTQYTAPGVLSANPSIIDVITDGGTSSSSFNVDGAAVVTGIDGISNPTNQTVLLLGARGSAGGIIVNDFHLNALMGDMINFGFVLTAVQRIRIQTYLGIKYGITLGNTSNQVSYLASDGTTTIWTGSGTYQNNIAGIGRDDLSALYQKQSQSVNSGSHVVM
ncbi:hypothetical protein, partial [Chryseobacterium sp. CCH4-E10]|uniref:hypothetical protein n=1 Tax=Chryseobacterium sp. CCH4-E10 TaxID=1768758 RepID=UPI000AC86E1B